ncbi:uncharacterized protein Aud_001413 [Aspergillus udagawae]|uniref:Uncharacterized protein n=1 Tax=Aspergillus udagawae TaxID=91492 RepID=A0A8E0QM77_9EURO|nr:uncharacterized protein Aud_001413 [Aspergillus udagawae]GIC85581.1 hypothetical protein Aud_001413 [Aspergillus udagawae]
MATDSPGAWALWFLMLGLYTFVTIALRGKPTVAFRFSENGKETIVYVYNDEHWLVCAVVDDLVARKTKVEDLEAQNEQPGVLNDNLEGTFQA